MKKNLKDDFDLKKIIQRVKKIEEE